MNRQTQQWEDGDTLFLRCSIWRQAAENVAESLTRGTRVVVQGRLKQRSYETREGEKRTVYEMDVDEVGPSLRYATAKVTRTQRAGAGFSGGGGAGGGSQAGSGSGNAGGASGGGQSDDPWATPANRGSGASTDPWSGGGASDEPPF